MRRCRILLLAALGVCCVPESPRAPAAVRSDVALLDIRLVLKVGSGEGAMADDSPKEVSASDTVWVYPVLKVAIGTAERDTLLLCNTTHVRAVGRDGDTTSPGWPLFRHIDIWNKLKRDIQLDWFEVVPCRQSYGPREGVRYRYQPVKDQGWALELTGRSGTRRLAVEARYGDQSVRSCYLASEASVASAPWLSVGPDTSVAGWALGLVGALAHRSGSTLEQTRNRVSCDSRGVVLYALSHTGYRFDAYNADVLDSMGEPVFRGYVRLGKLYDAEDRPAWLKLGQDVRRGDVIHFTSRRTYGIIASDSPVRGWSLGGIPAGLPIVGANSAGPRVQPLYTWLWTLGNIFGKSEFTIRRYPCIPPPPPPKVRKARPPAPPTQAVAPRAKKAAPAPKVTKSKTAGTAPKAAKTKPAAPEPKTAWPAPPAKTRK